MNGQGFGPVPTQSAGIVPTLAPSDVGAMGAGGGVPQGPSSMSAPEALGQPGQSSESDSLTSGAGRSTSLTQ